MENTAILIRANSSKVITLIGDMKTRTYVRTKADGAYDNTDANTLSAAADAIMSAPVGKINLTLSDRPKILVNMIQKAQRMSNDPVQAVVTAKTPLSLRESMSAAVAKMATALAQAKQADKSIIVRKIRSLSMWELVVDEDSLEEDLANGDMVTFSEGQNEEGTIVCKENSKLNGTFAVIKHPIKDENKYFVDRFVNIYDDDDNEIEKITVVEASKRDSVRTNSADIILLYAFSKCLGNITETIETKVDKATA